MSSGSSETLESLRRMTRPDTPPGLVSPTATSPSSRSSPRADHIWTSYLLAPLPMLAFDNDYGVEDDQGFRQHVPPATANNHASRLQLPSLSSIFPTLSSVRVPNTQIADSSPSFSPQSYHDRPHPVAIETPASSPHLASPAAPARMYAETLSSFMARPASSSRSSALKEKRAQSQSHAEPRWIARDSRPQNHKYDAQELSCPQLPSSRDTLVNYRGTRERSASNTEIEATDVEAYTADSLGPKIWTGTHFLPRFVRAAEVAGEGMCYFYDDGTYCKTVIDGEAVNAHWGVTKAGKPRKRLAIACVTCREKKIKCDPDFPRCIQCEKFGRVCSFKNAPRGGQHSSPSTSTAELHTDKTISLPQGFRESPSPATRPAYAGQLNNDESHQKRLRLDAESYKPVTRVSLPMSVNMSHDDSPHQGHVQLWDGACIPDDVLHRAWHTDVYMSDPRSIIGVVTQFFAYIDSSMILKFLPESTWKSHLSKTAQHKLPEDLMLLYSVLSIGVALSGTTKQIALEYAQVAHYAQKNTALNCLQLVQSRILIAAFYISIQRVHDAAELLSSAAKVAASLQLNVELEESSEANRTSYPLGLSRSGYKECRRRTMWSLFMLERHNGLFPKRAAMVSAEHLCIRLPTDDVSFEKQLERDEPVFDAHVQAASYACGSRNVHAKLVELTGLWADCQDALYRSACRPATASLEFTRVQALGKRIRSWYTSLPEYLSFSLVNLEDYLYSGNVGSFLSMHLLYHHAMIKVNRHHAAANLVSPEVQSSYAHTCFGHAAGILDVIDAFDGLHRGGSWLNRLPRITAIAIVEAIDALTATGSLCSITEQINSVRKALLTVDALTSMWEDMGRFRMRVSRRLDELVYIRGQDGQPTTNLVRGYRVVDTGREIRWQMLEPMDEMLPREMDVVYSLRL